MNKEYDAIIVLAGPDFDRLSFQNLANDIFIIAVDGGLNHLHSLTCKVNIHLGDMDSYLPTENLPTVIDTLLFSPEKDYSDYKLAIDYLFQRDYKSVALFGATGGRSDHVVQFYETSIAYCEKGMEITAFGQRETIYFTKEKLLLDDLTHGSTVSVFAGSENCTGVTYTGMKYPLNGYTLKRGLPLGLSNKSVTKQVTINHSDGVLVIVINK